MSRASSEVERLISRSPERLPLIAAALRPDADVCSVRSEDPAALFPGASRREAALAGLLLRVGCWAESHNLAQTIHSAEGSYWHAIIHRMEPDSGNASYWFGQTGTHAIFPDLFQRAAEILEPRGPKHWCLKTAWNPFLFIEWCDEARERGGQAEAAAVEIQMAEWELLFDWCIAAG